jgi:peptidoglycan hydrolase-like protein with peptidoglycan-binding domain
MSMNPRRNRWIRTTSATLAGLVIAGGLVGPIGHANASNDCECPLCCPSGLNKDAAALEVDAQTHATLLTMPTSLNVGARGPAVADLQRALISAGLTVRGGADGIFGQATQAAVRAFQTERGLAVTGTADGHTLVALGLLTTRIVAATPTATAKRGQAADPAKLPAPAQRPATPGVLTTPLTLGARGDMVAQLQRALISAGVDVRGGADGVFGAATQTAVRTFQRNQGLPVTGTVDVATFRAIMNGSGDESTTPTPAPAPGVDQSTVLLRPGAQGPDVKRVQEALIWNDIRVPGGADGVFGSGTAAALRTFQTNRGLTVNGVVDRATWEALNLHLDPSVAKHGIEVFPMQGPCFFIDTWGAARSGGRRHEGVDIIGASGLEIYAVVTGTITRVYNDRPGTLTGNGLRLTAPNGDYYFYAHLSGFAEGIKVGSEVEAGQVIGFNGSTGNSSTPHLHFEVHPGGGAAINPYPIVKALDGCSAGR